jgi:hypothetical protein
LVNRMCYGLRLDRGCEWRSGAFAKREIVMNAVGFGKRK